MVWVRLGLFLKILLRFSVYLGLLRFIRTTDYSP